MITDSAYIAQLKQLLSDKNKTISKLEKAVEKTADFLSDALCCPPNQKCVKKITPSACKKCWKAWMEEK